MPLLLRTALVTISFSMPLVAFAQGAPHMDVSGAYALSADREIDEKLEGWVVSSTGYVTPIFGITGEIGGHYKSLPVLGTRLRFSDLSFMAGPRVAAWTSNRVSLFGQILLGGTRRSVGILDQSDFRTHLALQLGGGADLWISRRFGTRIGADYRHLPAEQAPSGQFRVHVGAVVAGGR